MKAKINHLLNLIRPHPKLTPELYDPQTRPASTDGRAATAISGLRPRAEPASAKPARPDARSPWHGSASLAPRAALPAMPAMSAIPVPERIDRVGPKLRSAMKPIGRPEKPGSDLPVLKDRPERKQVRFVVPQGEGSTRSSLSTPILDGDVEIDLSKLFYKPALPPDPDAPEPRRTRSFP